MPLPPLSILDLASIVEGSNAATALQHTRDLAQHAERLGYHRFWLAEHHSMTGIASAATSLVIAHVASATSSIRVGAGGIMLPNHAPLVVAEQFGTLATLHPGRIDLGLGRAPGSDPATSRALRRDPQAADSFPQDVVELMGWFEPAVPGQPVQAVPGAGLDVPVWILGSSLFGARLAAVLGLPYAFASHFAPRMLSEAMALYRSRFEPSGRSGALEHPYVMLGVNVVAADSNDEAKYLFTSAQQMFVNIRRGRSGPLPPPREGVVDELAPWERAGMEEMLACSFVGDRDAVGGALTAFVDRTGADELMVVTPLHDHAARVRSFELLMSARHALADGDASQAKPAVGEPCGT